MFRISGSLRKQAPVIALTWILSLVTTLAVVHIAPILWPLQTEGIGNNAVTSEKIADLAVVTTKLADGTVTSAKIRDGTLTAIDLTDGAIVTMKISDGAITAEKITDGNVTTAKIAEGAVTSNKIADMAVTTSKIAEGAVTSSKIAEASINSDKIAGDAVVTVKLADGSVTSAKILDGTVTTVDLSDGAIVTIKVSDGSITTAKLADGAVTSEKLAEFSVTQEKIAEGAIVTEKLADASVTHTKMAEGALRTESSFIIWRDGSIYYARNGTTGEIQYSGTDATDVINSAIASIPTGGLVFLCDATYNIDGTINVTEKLNINIVGESWETKLNLTENSDADMMIITNSNYTAVKSLYFQGNRDAQSRGKGIVIVNSERVLIERCQFYEIKQTAIHVYGESPKSSLQPWIARNRIEKIGNSIDDNGIWIGDQAPDAHITDNDVGRVAGSAIYITSSGFIISSNTLWNSNYGLNVYLASSGTVTGNIVDNNRLDGINIDSCRNIVVSGNTAKLNSNNATGSSSGIYIYNSNFTTVVGNRAGASGDYTQETQRYGIKEYGVHADYNLIVGNIATGNRDPNRDIYSTGLHTVVSANQGRYIPKNAN